MPHNNKGRRRGKGRPANTTRHEEHDTSASASTTGVTMGDANVQQVGGQLARLTLSIWTVVIMDSVGNDAMRADAGVHYVCDLKDHIVTKYSGAPNPDFKANHIEVYACEDSDFVDREDIWKQWSVADAVPADDPALNARTPLQPIHCYLAIVDIRDANDPTKEVVHNLSTIEGPYSLGDARCSQICGQFPQDTGSVGLIEHKVLPTNGLLGLAPFQVTLETPKEVDELFIRRKTEFGDYFKRADTFLRDRIGWTKDVHTCLTRIRAATANTASFFEEYGELTPERLVLPCFICLDGDAGVELYFNESQARMRAYSKMFDNLLTGIPGCKQCRREHRVLIHNQEQTTSLKYVDMAVGHPSATVLLVEEKSEDADSNHSISVRLTDYKDNKADLVKCGRMARFFLSCASEDASIFVILAGGTRLDFCVACRVAPNYIAMDHLMTTYLTEEKDIISSMSAVLAVRRMIAEMDIRSFQGMSRMDLTQMTPGKPRGSGKGGGNDSGGNDGNHGPNGGNNGNPNGEEKERENGPEQGPNQGGGSKCADAPHLFLVDGLEDGPPTPPPPCMQDVPRGYRNYHVQEELVRSLYTRIWLGENVHSGDKVILKMLHVHLSQQERELSMHMECATHAPHVLPLLHTFWEADTFGDSYRVLVLPFLRPLPPVLCVRDLTILMRCVLKALCGIHLRRIVHLDVKPSNILMAPSSSPNSPPTFFLSDFGCAQSLLTGIRFAGTEAFMAPELIRGADIPRSRMCEHIGELYEDVDELCDCYSLGMTLIHLLIRVEGVPHSLLTNDSTYNYRLLATLAQTDPAHDGMDEGMGVLYRIAQGLLAFDPENRLSAAEALSLLEDSTSTTPASPATILNTSLPVSMTPHSPSNPKPLVSSGNNRSTISPTKWIFEDEHDKENILFTNHVF